MAAMFTDTMGQCLYHITPYLAFSYWILFAVYANQSFKNMHWYTSQWPLTVCQWSGHWCHVHGMHVWLICVIAIRKYSMHYEMKDAVME